MQRDPRLPTHTHTPVIHVHSLLTFSYFLIKIMFQTLDHSPHGFHCHRPSTIDSLQGHTENAASTSTIILDYLWIKDMII
jgi:hypothetical protein